MTNIIPLKTPSVFYRRHGLRLLDHFTHPPVNDWNIAALPLGSIFHYVDLELLADGPDASLAIFRSQPKKSLVYQVDDLTTLDGNPSEISISFVQRTQQFFQQHNAAFRKLNKLITLDHDPQSLVVLNYCLLAHKYRYTRNVYTHIHRWYNLFQTIIQQINEITTESSRQHFIRIGNPSPLPTLSNIAHAIEKGYDATAAGVFQDSSSMILLEIWKWLGHEREQSIFAKIPQNKVHLVNLLLEDHGKWFAINLGAINALRVTPDEEKQKPNEFILPFEKSRVSAKILQRRWLMMYLAVTDLKDKALGVQEDDAEAPIVFNQAEQLDEEDEGLHERMLKEDKALDVQMARLAEIHEQQAVQIEESSKSSVAAVLEEAPPELHNNIQQLCDIMVADGVMTPAKHTKIVKAAQLYKSIPVGADQTPMAEFVKIDPKSLAVRDTGHIPDHSAITDKSLTKSSLHDVIPRYVEEFHHKHLAAMTMHVQHQGYALTDYKVKENTDIMGSTTEISFNVLPVVGEQGPPIKVHLPTLNKDGTFTTNGSTYRLRILKSEPPIAKLSPDRVGLNSYYGTKIFINRGRKPSSSWALWLKDEIMAKAVDSSDASITAVIPGNVFNNRSKCPRAYTTLAAAFVSFRSKGHMFYFDVNALEKNFPTAVIVAAKKKAMVPIATSVDEKSHLLIDLLNTLYRVDQEGNLEPIGQIEEYFDLDITSAPVDFVEMSLLGNDVPIGIVLAYYFGLNRLMKMLNVQPRRVVASARKGLEKNEYELQFLDESLIFSRDDHYAALILSGFNAYHRSIRNYESTAFDRPGVYTNLFEANKMNSRYIEELGLLKNMFVDPITAEVLKLMHEPQTFTGLLLRACEMLLDDYHSKRGDADAVRLKGNERIAGAYYKELVTAIRTHRRRPDKARQPLTMKPFAVMQRIQEDSAKNMQDDINPFQPIKEMGMVTAMGDGGQNIRSLTAETRVFSPDLLGVMSESTVDNGSVGANENMSANPGFANMYGMVKKFDPKKDGPSSLLSTAALLCARTNYDDMKRANFIGIQLSHTIACEGYHQTTWRTGMELVIPHTTTAGYCVTAKQPCEVIEVSKHAVVVKHEDGREEGFKLSTWYGHASGFNLPHRFVTTCRVGQKLEVGQAIVYNPYFFEPDFFDPTRVVLKMSRNALTALQEVPTTFEDANGISMRFAGQFGSPIAEIRNIVVRKDEEIKNLVKIGDQVDHRTQLCFIEDPVSSKHSALDQTTHDALELLTHQTPRAGVRGTVEKIEVLYRCEITEMSQTLQDLAMASDRSHANEARAQRRVGFTGKVDGAFRINGDPMPEDYVCVRVYMTFIAPMGMSDKIVFMHQAKSVTSEIMTDDIRTMDGRIIDARFSYRSIAARIIRSPDIIGTGMACLEQIEARAVARHFGQPLPAPIDLNKLEAAAA